jgi:hypothetical protein
MSIPLYFMRPVYGKPQELEPRHTDAIDDEARRCVMKGAAFLDRICEGWHNHIDVPKLRIQCPCNCIAGQLFGSWDSFLNLYGRMSGRYDLDLLPPLMSMGFIACTPGHFAALNSHWRSLITDRLIQQLRQAPAMACAAT